LQCSPLREGSPAGFVPADAPGRFCQGFVTVGGRPMSLLLSDDGVCGSMYRDA